jgi:ubiquitin-conjugating enzyme E2 G1
MSKSTSTASNTLLLRRQLTELTKHPVEGFSAGPFVVFLVHILYHDLWKGLVDENNLYEWEILVIGCIYSSHFTSFHNN